MADITKYVFVERKRALQVAASCGLGVIEEDAELTGYQTYIVEQWVCDRNKASNTVKVFTGNQSHRIKVCVIAISTADLQHPRPELSTFFKTTTPMKLKTTPLGKIMLMDPSELPYDMDMVVVPDGDYDKWISQAYVNINLRRSNCTGRSALNLRKPNPASEEKFRSIYKIADAVHFEEAVIKLVILAQVALYLFNLLKKDYIDGLLCNETMAAFWKFYTHYNPHKSPEYQLKEPWMEPHLLTALITKLIVCRNKLQAYNFTTIKDPFADYELFRYDIEEYQRVKNLKRTKLIDLETLRKLNEYSVGQLKVRNVIKSKLDDISGVHNSPLFNEASEPEVFRDHATIESLRAIWRPKLKGGLGNDSEKQQHELLHMIKGVSARTTRTSGAAAEILSKVAGSLPWISTSDHRHAKQERSNIVSPTKSLSPTRPAEVMHTKSSPTYPSVTSSSSPRAQSQDTVPTVNRHTLARKPSPLAFETQISSDDDLHSDSYRSEPDIRTPFILTENIDSDTSPSNKDTSPPTVRERESPSSCASSPSSSHPSPLIASADVDTRDFTKIEKPYPSTKHTRSMSDSAVAYKYDKTHVFHCKPAKKGYLRRAEIQRANSVAVMATAVDRTLNDTPSQASQRPSAHMDVRTYIIYEKLRRQHMSLKATYINLQKTTHIYEVIANRLRATYLRRFKEFEQIQHGAKQVIEEQHETERRLKEVEDESAKLHYELNVLNDYLKDIEDNVCAFYGKVDLLEQKMDDSQQSITTMLLLGNYFNHYWQKVKYWIGWRPPAAGPSSMYKESTSSIPSSSTPST
ncbi:uncharacterized protein BYT42DRAFT_129362 [Radiomyces spectabilis]|uniref:uncharacterized protein n=1 Tax=Radiomyces spectabilis TaxID=64574 RepID=UPI002220C382|nr:uncharacterized protein BYT42DRAFT_129362 [Radiomyces spectabilis]KAI8367524.1 hypothetical protein BYT42DRAFT_129362 [Radiomyces spectabilis]